MIKKGLLFCTLESKVILMICWLRKEDGEWGDRPQELKKRKKKERDGTTDRVRMLTVMCPHSSDTILWHSSAGLLHVRRAEEREGERSRQCPLSTLRQQLVEYALTLRRAIQAWTGASHGPAAFIRWKWMDGRCLFSSCKQKRSSAQLKPDRKHRGRLN